MLSFFRQRGLTNVLYGAIILATILTFVIEFRPNASQRTASLNESCVARVRGRCIDPKDFGAAYRILMPSRSAEASRRLNVKRVALDGLIERELLDDEARRLGISVSDDEVTDQLYSGFVRVSVPAADPGVAQSIFQEMYQAYVRAGLVSQEVAQAHFNERDTAIPVDFRDPKTKKFSMKVYERVVRNLSNRSTTEFREQQARELLAAKMRDVIREPIRVSGNEAWHAYNQSRSQATVEYVTVKESWAARWAVDAKPAELAAWVKENQAAFDGTLESRQKEDAPKAGHIRHILVKLPYGAGDDEKAAAIAKLSWAASRVKAGEAFAEVARDVSDDTQSAAQGGDVGEKTDAFVGPFKSAADALRPGETTAQAIETQFGYHLIEKDDPARAADVAAEVARGLPRSMFAKEKATEAAKRLAKSVATAMRSGKTADDAVRDTIAPYAATGPVALLRVVAAPASDADAGANRSHAQPEVSSAPAAKRFDSTTDTDRPKVQISNAFNSGGDPFPGLSPEATASVVTFAFAAQVGDVMDDPVRDADGFVVVALKERKTVTREDFDKDRDLVEQDLTRAKRDEAMALYVKGLREKAKDSIKIDESYVREIRVDGGAESDDDEEDQN